MSAEITPLNENWGATAAAADALQRCPNEAAFVAIWIHPTKGVQWSKANTDFASLSMLAAVLAEFSQAIARSEIER